MLYLRLLLRVTISLNSLTQENNSCVRKLSVIRNENTRRRSSCERVSWKYGKRLVIISTPVEWSRCKDVQMSSHYGFNTFECESKSGLWVGGSSRLHRRGLWCTFQNRLWFDAKLRLICLSTEYNAVGEIAFKIALAYRILYRKYKIASPTSQLSWLLKDRGKILPWRRC